MSEKPSKQELKEKFGPPPYVDLGARVAKYRRAAAKAGGVKNMYPWDRHAYADAVEEAIRAKHRMLHMRPAPKEIGAYRYSPPPVSRLLRYENPIRMVGDPPHDGSWRGREKAVYEHMMRPRHVHP